MTATRLATLDLPEGNAMRAPGDASGSMAFEAAIDEMAHELNLDPIEFRVRNDTQQDPEKPARVYSTRKLVECLRTGAEKFGWDGRNPQPGKVRDGSWLVGLGVTTAYRGAPAQESAARVRVDASGVVTVETDMTVAVNVLTAETRVRMLAVCSAGRILNPKSARSQVIGAMTMGVGAALMEELAVDKHLGFFVNHDLASYEVPVHADIPHQDVIFLEGEDPTLSRMKAMGVGELGICGAAAAVANAIYNATGIRVRNYPITLDKLLPSLGVRTA